MYQVQVQAMAAGKKGSDSLQDLHLRLGLRCHRALAQQAGAQAAPREGEGLRHQRRPGCAARRRLHAERGALEPVHVEAAQRREIEARGRLRADRPVAATRQGVWINVDTPTAE